MNKKTHKHEWKTWTLIGSEFRCKICGDLGKSTKRFNRKTNKEEWTIRKMG